MACDSALVLKRILAVQPAAGLLATWSESEYSAPAGLTPVSRPICAIRRGRLLPTNSALIYSFLICRTSAATPLEEAPLPVFTSGVARHFTPWALAQQPKTSCETMTCAATPGCWPGKRG